MLYMNIKIKILKMIRLPAAPLRAKSTINIIHKILLASKEKKISSSFISVSHVPPISVKAFVPAHSPSILMLAIRRIVRKSKSQTCHEVEVHITCIAPIRSQCFKCVSINLTKC